MKNKTKVDIALFSLLIIWIMTSGYFIYLLKGEGNICVANPLQYGVRDMVKGLGEPGACNCEPDLERCICRAGKYQQPFIVTSNTTELFNSYP